MNLKKIFLKKPDKSGIISGVILLILFLTYICGYWKLVKASSHSTQDGYFLVFFNSQLQLERDNYVAVCIPSKEFANVAISYGLPKNNRYCQYSTTPLIKKIIGIPGDSFIINENGVIINGTRETNSELVPELANKQYSKRSASIPANSYLVLGTNKRSFDSRYYGPVPRQYIIGKAYLILPL